MTDTNLIEPEARVRLFVEVELGPRAVVGLSSEQAHYLQHVLRRRAGDALLLFNGRDGEWTARIEGVGRGWCSVAVEAQRRPQRRAPDLWLVFAPIKRARLDFLAEKATELGVSALWPMFTRHTAVARVNVERLRANSIEAAEQCERLSVPEIFEPADFDDVLARWPNERRILLLDETGQALPLAAALAETRTAAASPWAVMVGPEGGFERRELDALRRLSFVTPAALGPRVLRADTAAIAALACWQALLGDWRTETRATSGGLVPHS
jgi:16S rRNA (uracil1498-N3)-methyltransferase